MNFNKSMIWSALSLRTSYKYELIDTNVKIFWNKAII